MYIDQTLNRIGIMGVSRLKASNIITKLKNRKPFIMGHEKFHKFAVLLPLVEIEEETHILFEVRSMNLRKQPGDICFPGGRVDKEDQSEYHAAIRETSEELGISNDHIFDVVPLDYIVSGFQGIIYPYLGRIKDINQINPNNNEVKETFTVPLTFFLNTEPKIYKVSFEVVPENNFPYDLIIGGENYDWRARQTEQIFYQYKDRVIWGLTARILTHLIDLLET